MGKAKKAEPSRTEKEFVIPIVVGGVARALPKKGDRAMYEWVLYLRSPDDKPLSKWISKVDFHLHKTVQEHQRQIKAEPFETHVAEVWGNFKVPVRVHMNEATFGEKLHIDVRQLEVVLEPAVQAPHRLPTRRGNEERFGCRPTPPEAPQDPAAANAANPDAAPAQPQPPKGGAPAVFVYERADEIIFAPLASATSSIAAATRSLEDAAPLRPRGPKGFPVWELVQKHRPAWQMNEALQAERFEEMLAGMADINADLEHNLRALMWEKAEALQKRGHVQRLVDEAKDARQAKKRRMDGGDKDDEQRSVEPSNADKSPAKDA